MSAATRLSALLALLLCGAIFGFYYAWVCSTMWGLDMAAPQVAVAAMQAMNASVRNAVFAPSFFGTPVVLLLTAALAWRDNRRPAAKGFAPPSWATAGRTRVSISSMISPTISAVSPS